MACSDLTIVVVRRSWRAVPGARPARARRRPLRRDAAHSPHPRRPAHPRRPGHRSPAQGIDLFPTACALLDLPVPGALTGVSLLGDPPADRAIVSELRQGDPDAADRAARRDWKLIHAPASRQSELYDLVADPGEHTNQWDDRGRGLWLSSPGSTRGSPPRRRPRRGRRLPRPNRRSAISLRALGYAE